MTLLRTSLRNFFSHKGRMVLSGAAVVISVAFVCGTLVFTSTMNTTFDRLFAETASDVMIAPPAEDGETAVDAPDSSGRPDTLPASVTAEVASVDGVRDVTGVIESQSAVVVDEDNESIGPTTGAPTMGVSWDRIALRSVELGEGSEPAGPGEVLLDADTADRTGLGTGDELRLLTVFGDHPMTISGIAEFQVTNPGATVVFLETSAAQEYLLGGEEAFTAVYVDAAEGVADAELKQRVAGVLGEGTYKLQTAEEYIQENRDAIGQIMDVIQYVLLGFAGIALLVGIFLIVITFSMLVAQRTRELGLMRAVGASRGQVNRTVLTEALLLGVFGSALGFGAGLGLAVGLMELMGLMGMNLSTDDLTIGWDVPVTGMVLGIVVTLVAAYIPGRRAGRITPMAALRDAGTPGDARAGRLRAVLGTVLTLGGAAALAGVESTGSAADGGSYLAAGVVLTLVGLILAAPALVGLVVRALSAVLLRGFGPVGRLAERNALRNPRRTGATASALMIGLALVAGMSVVGSSMVASATQEIDDTLGADYIISTSTFTPVLPDVEAAVREVGGLASVTDVRSLTAEVTVPGGEGSETFDRVVSVAPPSYMDDITVETLEGDLAAAYEPGGLAVDSDSADSRGLAVGDELEVAFGDGGTAALTVRAITSADSSVEGGAWYAGLETARAHVPEEAMPLPLMLFATAEDGADTVTVAAALETAMEAYPQMEVRDQSEFKDLIQQQVGQLLNMVYGLLLLAIVVAVLGVVNTLALSVVERTREIGLMRAVGLSRRQLRRMIRLESVVIALFGALLGVGLGLAWGIAGHRLLALEGMPVLAIPWVTILVVLAGAMVVGRLAAVFPAFRAARMNVLRAIATE